MIAFWLGLGLLNPSAAEPPVEPPATGAIGGGSFQQAEAEWTARQKWAKEIDSLLQDAADEGAPPQGEGSPTTQAAQDAPREPRTARPAPTPLRPSVALSGLLAQLDGYRKQQADALRLALQQRDRQLALALVLAAEQQLREDEEAVLMLLLEVA